MNTRTLIAIPYELTRAPLWVIDTQLVQRLPRDSFPRLAFDRALGSYDQFAGRLLANDDIVRMGIDRATRSEMLADAIGLERGATEQQGKRVAVANARQQATRQKQAAQQRAERRTATIRERLAQKDKAADTRQANAQRTATAKLDHAAAAKAAARRTRSDANKLGALADAKRAGRKK